MGSDSVCPILTSCLSRTLQQYCTHLLSHTVIYNSLGRAVSLEMYSVFSKEKRDVAIVTKSGAAKSFNSRLSLLYISADPLTVPAAAASFPPLTSIRPVPMEKFPRRPNPTPADPTLPPSLGRLGGNIVRQDRWQWQDCRSRIFTFIIKHICYCRLYL